MSFLRKCLPVLVPLVASIAAVQAADKDKEAFKPGPAASYESKQTSNGVTIAAVAYDSPELAKQAFGKMNPYQYGVLPVLVVIQNDSGKTIQLQRMTVEYIDADRNRVESTPARDVPFLAIHPKKPKVIDTPIPGVSVSSRAKKGPLSGWEIEGRSFTPRMLPPNESANGFFYFQTGHRSGGKLYVTGLQEAPSGKELLYFEIPLQAH